MQALPAPLLFAVNHLLDQAAWARTKLAPFAGQAARLTLPPLDAVFVITPDGRIAAPTGAATDIVPEVRLLLPASTPLLALQGQDAVMRAVRIEGLAEFAEALGFVLRHLEWDIEEDLSRLTGDMAAHRLVGSARSALAWQRQTAQSLGENLVEYLTEEQPLLASRAAIADFCTGVRRLNDDLHGLEQRLKRLG